MTEDIDIFNTNADKLAQSCASLQFCNNVNLLRENLVWSKNSFRHIKESNDLAYHLAEAELKTYPTKFLTKEIVKLFTDYFSCGKCWFSTKLKANSKIFREGDLTEYDVTSKRFIEFDPRVDHIKPSGNCLIKAQANNIENDIAGTVTYVIKLVKSKRNQLSDEFVQQLIYIGYAKGYDFVAYDKTSDADSICFYVKYEAKFQEAEIIVNDKLYHIAPLSLKDKILKFGLAPKSATAINGVNVRHSDRVYLFNEYNEANIRYFLAQVNKFSKTYNKFFKQLFQTKQFAVFEIDVSKLADIKLYRDNMFQSIDDKKPTAVYTYSNIPPNCLKFVNSISI